MGQYLPHYEWAGLLAVSMLLWCWHWVKPRYGMAAAAFLGYMALSSIWVWVYVENRYLPLNAYDQMALRYFACDSIARLMLLVVPLMLLCEQKDTFLFLGEVLVGTFVFINSLVVVYGFLKHGCVAVNSCGGAGNPSIMVGLTVCALPVVVKSLRIQWPFILLVGAAAVASKSSVALGLFGIYLGFAVSQYNPLLFGYAICASMIPLWIGLFTLRPEELFNSGDRFLLWQYMMPKWATWWNIPAGTGLGTYHVFSINLQAVKNVAQGFYWDTMHNDWLQMLFECGVGGALLMIVTFLAALKKMIVAKEFGIAMSIILFGIFMGVNPALHHALPTLFGAWLFIYALKRQPHTHEGAIYA